MYAGELHRQDVRPKTSVWNELFVNNFEFKLSVFCFEIVEFHFKKEIFGLLVEF